MTFSAQLGPGSLCSVVLICCGCWLKVFSIVGGACGVLPALLFLERTFALDMRPQQTQGCSGPEIREESEDARLAALPTGLLDSKEVFLEVVSRRPTVCQDPPCVR